VRVRGHGVVRLYADAVVGWRDMPLTTLEWYCPGVGLVKSRHEMLNQHDEVVMRMEGYGMFGQRPAASS